MGQRFEMPIFQGFDGNGDPLSGGLLYSYIAESSTPKSLYYDKELTTPASNPVILNSYGYAQNGSNVTTGLYGTGTYKLVLNNSAGVQQWSIDNVSGGGGGGDGGAYVSDYGCDIAAAITALGATETTLTIDCDVSVTTGNPVFPATLNIRWIRGNIITIATGQVLTIGNMTDPGPFELFAGAGTVVFATTGSVNLIRPEWWASPGLAEAIACSGSSGDIPVHLLDKTYTITTGLSTNRPLQLIGTRARNGSIINTNSAIRMLDINKDQATPINGVKIVGVYFDGNEVATSGVHMENGAYFYWEDVEVREIAGRALSVLGMWDGTFHNCQFMQSGVYATSTPAGYIGKTALNRASNSIKFTGHCNFERSDYSHIIIERSWAISFIGTKFHGHPLTLNSANTFDLIQVLGASRISFINPQMVNCRRYGIYVGVSGTAKSHVVVVGGTFTGAGNYNLTPLAIASISNASPAVVTTTPDHGFINNDVVYFNKISDDNGDGTDMNTLNHVMDEIPYVVTRTGAKTFTIPVDTTLYADPANLDGYNVHTANTGFVVNATDTNQAWWIYVASGSAVISGNLFYYVATTANCTFYDNADLLYPSMVKHASHDLTDGEVIYFNPIAGVTGISTFTTYYVVNATTDYFQVAATEDGAAIELGVLTTATGTYVIEESMSYSCVGGDIFCDPANTEDMIYNSNKHGGAAGHSILDASGGDYHYFKGTKVFKHKDVNSVPIIFRIEDGVMTSSTTTRNTFSMLLNGDLRWNGTTGVSQIILGRSADNILSLEGPASGIDTKLSLNRIHLRALTAEPASPVIGDIVRADRTTWDPKIIGSGGDYLVWYNGSAWKLLNEQ